MSFRTKILMLSVMGIGITCGMMIFTVWGQKSLLRSTIRAEVDELGHQQCEAVAKDVHAMLTVQNESIKQKVRSDLNVARNILHGMGEIGFADDSVSWTAVNQYTKEAIGLQLPKMTVGGQWLGRNSDPGVASPVVDDVKKLVGGTCTVFQRMNDGGGHAPSVHERGRRRRLACHRDIHPGGQSRWYSESGCFYSTLGQYLCWASLCCQ